MTTENNEKKVAFDTLINYDINSSNCNSNYINSTQNLPNLKQAIADNSVIEYVQVTNSQAIVVTQDEVWVRNSVEQKSFLPQASTDKTNSIETTKKLLDTAIVLGKRTASIEEQLPELSVKNWIWSLVSQYHVAHATPQLMREAAQKFREQGRDCLAEWAAEKAQEETGHDQLALKDIKSLGYQAQALVDAYMPDSAKVLVDYFIRSVRTADPIKVVGYAYTLERLALAIKEKHIQKIEAIIPPGVKATRCLRVHSSIGSDVEHVDEALETIAQLTSAERSQIAIACCETAQLYFSTSGQEFPSA
jgi:pyrroloquinoline quinone (PQQ) biosynthesis protein C